MARQAAGNVVTVNSMVKASPSNRLTCTSVMPRSLRNRAYHERENLTIDVGNNGSEGQQTDAIPGVAGINGNRLLDIQSPLQIQAPTDEH